jgi:hypothetical protein
MRLRAPRKKRMKCTEKVSRYLGQMGRGMEYRLQTAGERPAAKEILILDNFSLFGHSEGKRYGREK